MTKIFLLFFTVIFNTTIVFSQDKNLYAGIEIGSKGIKMSVIDVDNIKKGDFIVKSFWTENIAIAKGIAIDGNLAEDDISKAVNAVKTNYEKILKQNEIFDHNIFIVGSSGVSMAYNKDILKNKIKLATNKDLEFIDAVKEGEMLFKGVIPPKYYLNSTVLDIGGGNTKGGYVDMPNKNNFVFFPINFDYGTITLTESIAKKQKSKENISEYLDLLFSFLPTLREKIKSTYNTRSKVFQKENIYTSGGAVWAFYTLFFSSNLKNNFNEFKLEDVIMYNSMIKNNFNYFKQLALTDKNVEKVLNTYSHKHLISASTLLLSCLEDIPNITTKKIYYAKEGQIAWLVSYIAERSTKLKIGWQNTN